MLDGEFVEKMAEHFHRPMAVMVNGEERLLLPADWQERSRQVPIPPTLKIGTLTGLIEYVKGPVGRDKIGLGELLVHVLNPDTVNVLGDLEPETALFRRVTYLQATTEFVGPCPFKFSEFLDAEQFVIGLQAGFVESETRAKLLEFVGTVKEGTVRETSDDGYAQQVTARQSVALVETARVPNPVVLRPYRTFREVEQPKSTFLLRVRSDDGPKPKLALFPADGQAWRLEAVQFVADFIRHGLGGMPGVTILA